MKLFVLEYSFHATIDHSILDAFLRRSLPLGLCIVTEVTDEEQCIGMTVCKCVCVGGGDGGGGVTVCHSIQHESHFGLQPSSINRTNDRAGWKIRVDRDLRYCST